MFDLVAKGLQNSEIADQLNVAENTVKWHLGNIFDKLGVNNRTRAILRARELGLVD